MKFFILTAILTLGLGTAAPVALATDKVSKDAHKHMSDTAKEAYGGQKGDAKKAMDKAEKEAEKAEKEAKKAKDKMKKEY